MHAVHVPAARELGSPILLVHDWPGSFLQMLPLAERLARRRPVIVPSLPGFGLSEAPAEPGWNLARTAAALDAVMADAGHARYAVHGSDFGVNVALWLGAHRPGRVAWAHACATHLEPPATDPDDATDEERRFLERASRIAAGRVTAARACSRRPRRSSRSAAPMDRARSSRAAG